jgi:hypothetical protein
MTQFVAHSSWMPAEQTHSEIKLEDDQQQQTDLLRHHCPRSLSHAGSIAELRS